MADKTIPAFKILRGNVGINTTGPGSLFNVYVASQRQLDFYGGTSPSGNNYVAALKLGRGKTSNSALEIKYDSENAEHAYITRLYTNATLHFDKQGVDQMTILSDGNVGIGTTTPVEKLDVNGNTVVRGSVYFDGVSSSYIDNASHDLQLRGAGGVSLWTHDSTWKERLTVTDPGKLQLHTYGSGTHTGTSAYKLSVDSSGNVIETAIGAGAVDGAGTANYISKWTDGDTIGNSQIFDNGTNVGIGTATPVNKLDVRGDFIMDKTNNAYGGMRLWDDSTGDYNVYLDMGRDQSATQFHIRYGGRTANSQTWSSGTDVAVFSRNKSWIPNGKVGIGTTAPGHKLHISTSADEKNLYLEPCGATTHYAFQVEANSLTTGGAAYFYSFSSTTNSRKLVYINNDHPSASGTTALYIKQDSTGAALVTMGGNVGIGTDGPVKKLDVRAAASWDGIHIGSTAGSATAIDFARSTTHANPTARIGVAEPAATHTSDMRFYTSDASGSAPNLVEKMRINQNGIVIINDTATTNNNNARLYVNGPVYGSEFDLPSGGVIDWANGDARIAEGLSSNYSLSLQNYDGSSAMVTTMFLESGGNVGIGTAAPAEKLHVNAGDIVITGAKQLISINAYTQAAPGMLTIQGPSTGATSLGSGTWGIMIGPQHTRSTVANTYYAGIAFNHLLNNGGAVTYNNHPQAWIGTRLHDTPGSERAFLVFSTKSGTGVTASDVPVERMCIDPVAGYVGIGTTDPGVLLEISGTNPAFDLAQAGTSIFRTELDGANDVYQTVYGSGNKWLLRVNSSTNALTADGNGQIGIGTATPATPLHVYTDSASGQEIMLQNDGSGEVGLILRTDRKSNGALTGWIGFDAHDAGDNNTRYATIEAYSTDTSNGSEDGALRFSVMAGGSDVESMTIAARSGHSDIGWVGIGTNAPAFPLQVDGPNLVNGSAKRIVCFRDTTSAAAGTGAGIALGGYTNGTASAINDFGVIQGIKENGSAGDYASALTFHTRANGANTAEQMRITSTGSVGIGCTPVRELDVDGRVRADTYGFRSDTTLRWYYFDDYSGSNFIGRGGNAYTSLYDGGALSMAWKGGSVGIGTTNPGQKLSVFNGRIGLTDGYQIGSHDGETGMYVDQDTDIRFQVGGAHYLTLTDACVLQLATTDTNIANTILKVNNNKSNGAAQLYLEGKRTSSNDTGQLIFANNGNVASAIKAFSGADEGDLRFYTSAAGSGSTLTEYMRITSAGLVNVGGTGTFSQVNVESSVSGKYLYMDDGTNAAWDLRAESAASSVIQTPGTGWGSWAAMDLRANYFKFKPNNVEIMRVISTGVGIGTTSPSYALDVYKSVTGNWLSRIHNTATSGNSSGLLVRMDEPGSTGFAFAALVNGNYKLAVKPDGKVGIGTASPTNNLVVYATGHQVNFVTETDDHSGMRVKGAAAKDKYILFNDQCKMGYQHSTATLHFCRSGAFGDNHLVIDSSGNVGIGIATPDHNLQISYSSGVTDTTAGFLSGAAGPGFRLQNTSTTASTYAPIDFRCSDADARIAFQYSGTSNQGQLLFITEANSNSPKFGIYDRGDGATKILVNDTTVTTAANKTFHTRWSSSNTTITTGEGLLGGAAGTGALLENTNSTAGIYANLDFRAYDADARIAVKRVAANTADFYFIHDNGGSAATSMVVKANGNVGIGSTNPGYPLQVYYGGGAGIGLQVKGSANRSKLVVSDNDTSAYVIAEDSYASFGRNDSLTANNLNINAAGCVGIGIAAPTALLHAVASGTEICLGLKGGNNLPDNLLINGLNSSAQGVFNVRNNGNTYATQYGFYKSGSLIGGYLELTNQAGDSSSNDVTLTAAHSTNSVVLRAAKNVEMWTYSGGAYVRRVMVEQGGNVGIGVTAPGYKLQVNGDFAASSKSFVIDHPTKEDKQLIHGSLEGPEYGVYHRGTIQSNTITLPDYWSGLVRGDSITVQLTPRGEFQHLYVVSYSLTEVIIGAADSETINCFYTIYGERADIDRLEVEKEV